MVRYIADALRCAVLALVRSLIRILTGKYGVSLTLLLFWKSDVYERTVPNFALESLALHKSDPRPVIYSYEELEAGLTGDSYWNSAQHELLVTGKVRQ